MTKLLQPDARSAPATARNRDPILVVLRRVLPTKGTVLEIASGTGEHAVYFAQALPDLTWQPSDPDETARKSIAAHRERGELSNLLPPLDIDVSKETWPITRVDAVVAINMIHIAPWAATEGLMAGAERLLLPGGVLYLYGPYKENGQHTAPSNALFDADLMARNAEWGVRDLSEVRALATRHKLDFVERASMPANNLSVVFRKRVN
jgi:SAM-dependent methyltransferase